MDDCDLETLSVKPGKLTPAFKRDLTEYHVTVTSDVKEITFDCFTSDSNASKCISGSDGGRTVPLKEGEVNDIKIEVTAEDGTSKDYWVHVKRLSARDAVLSNLKVSIGQLEPTFSSSVYEYSCTVPCSIPDVVVTPVVPDKKSVFVVNGEGADKSIALNVGDTLVNVQVTSPDGSNNQTYKVIFTRKQIPRYVELVDEQLRVELEDPVSLAVMYRPISVRDSEPKHSFSAPIIDEFTKTSKVDPLNDVPLDPSWRVEDYDLDATLSAACGFLPLCNGGRSPTVKIAALGAELKNVSTDAKPATDKKFETNCPVMHTVEVRKWEKSMQQIYDETDTTKLNGAAEESLQKYLSSLPKPGWNQGEPAKGENPLQHLDHAIHCYASAIRVRPKDANFHLQLGFALEERYLAEDIYGLKSKDDDASADHAGSNKQAQESSKDEECQAICQLRGVGPGAPLALQLKAIDEEYHHLLETHQSGKADHVQALYAWKSKQATKEGAAASKVSDDENALGQAYLKYLDALSLDECKGQHHFQVGRMLVIQGKYKEAVPRLEAALGWLPSLAMARFYLGFALSLQEDGAGPRSKEAIELLRDSMEGLLSKNTEEALSAETTSWKMKCTLTSDLLRPNNVHLLRGMIQLSKLLKTNPDVKDCMSPKHVLHTAALVASQVLPTVHRRDTYRQVEWVLLEAHSMLLDDLLETCKDKVSLIALRCQRLTALIKHTTLPRSAEINSLQKRTIERLVSIEPCSSYALCLLGDTQLALYDANPEGSDSNTLLEDAKKSYQTSISLEGKPAAGSPPQTLTEQKWWQDKVKAEEEKKAASAAASAKAAAPAAAKAGGTAARGAARGGAAAGRGAARGASTPTVRGARGAGTSVRGGRGGAKAAAATAPAQAKPQKGAKLRGAATKAPPTTSKAAAPAKSTPPSGKPVAAQEAPKPEEPTPAEAPAPAPVPSNVPINKKSYQARLGLARALARKADDLAECKKYYNEVIDMAPHVHDAYVESAELLAKSDPMGAVDIYAKFPVPDTPTFDDAFIFGEIVHLLMKSEKYDDPRLAPNMIKMGQIMGIGYLDKNVKTLEDKFKYDILKVVFAGVHGKGVDDPQMVAFFKMKFWN